MTANLVIHDAQILTAATFGAMQAEKIDTVAAQTEAERILAEARAEAEAIVAEAEAKAADVQEDLKLIADESLMKFVDTQAIDRVAQAVQQTLDEAQKVRDDFDAFTPWLRDFVTTAVTRITGQQPPEKLWGDVLTQALVDVRDRWDIVLRCHAACAPLFTHLLDQNPKLAGQIREVQIDRTLREDEVHLVTAKGVVDLSIATQVETVLRTIDEVKG